MYNQTIPIVIMWPIRRHSFTSEGFICIILLLLVRVQFNRLNFTTDHVIWWSTIRLLIGYVFSSTQHPLAPVSVAVLQLIPIYQRKCDINAAGLSLSVMWSNVVWKYLTCSFDLLVSVSISVFCSIIQVTVLIPVTRPNIVVPINVTIRAFSVVITCA